MSKFESKIDELTVIRQEDVAEKFNLKRPRKCFRIHAVEIAGKTAGFLQPCEWKNDIPFSDRLSASGTIVAPDNTASIHFPAPPVEVQGGGTGDKGSVTEINGVNYPTQGYEVNGEIMMLVDMSQAFDANVNLIVAYLDLSHMTELDDMLATMTIE